MGPAVCLGPGAISMKEDWVQGAPLHSHTQTSYAGTRAFMRHRARVALYNLFFARSIVTRCLGMGGVFLPWGNGLKISYDDFEFDHIFAQFFEFEIIYLL